MLRFFKNKKTQNKEEKQTKDIYTVINNWFKKTLITEEERVINKAVKKKLLYFIIKIDKDLILKMKVTKEKKD